MSYISYEFDYIPTNFTNTTTYIDYWTHLEAGAANYGEDGHTKLSQAKTVFNELSFISDKSNYFDNLPEEENFSYSPDHQYAVLFNTLDILVKEGGKKGIFHVNDLFDDYTNYATIHLRNYATKMGYNDIIIDPIVGDYTTLSPEHSLAPYGKGKYDTVHLKNPEISFYHYGIDGDTMLSNDITREHARNKLQILANFSCYGMDFFPIDFNNAFIPEEEYDEYILQGIFYKQTSSWSAVGYNFPAGVTAPTTFGAVYFIESNIYC